MDIFEMNKYLLLFGLCISLVFLSGCSEDLIYVSSESGTINITNNITTTTNITNNITTYITNNFTVSNSSYQCSSTDKLSNVSIINGNITGVCTTDQTGGGATFTSYQGFAYNKVLEDDQCGVQTTTGEAWYGTAIGSGTTTTSTGYMTHPCVRALRSSTTASSGYCFNLGVTNLLLNGSESTDIIFSKLAQSGNITGAKIGFFDVVTTANPVDGVYFNITNVTTQAIVRANNVQYNTSLTYNIVATSWYRFRVEVINGTTANFYIYNSTSTTGAGNTNLVWNDTINGVMPVASGRQTGHGVCVYKRGGTTAQDLLYLDYMNLNINRTIIR